MKLTKEQISRFIESYFTDSRDETLEKRATEYLSKVDIDDICTSYLVGCSPNGHVVLFADDESELSVSQDSIDRILYENVFLSVD